MTNTQAILLDINSLLAGEWPQCLALLTYAYPLSNNDNKRPIEHTHLIGLLKKTSGSSNISKAIEAELEPVESLDGESYACLKFIDQLFDNYLKNNKLHSDIHPMLNHFRGESAIAMLQQTLPWHESTGLTAQFNNLYTNAIGWQPELGRAAERFYHQLQTIFNASSETSATPESTLDSFNVFFQKEQGRIQKLEKRLHDAELGALHAKHAQQLSARTLNQHMAGQQLPACITQFLQGPWRESMRLLIISDGKDSQNWQKILRLTETLIWSFQPINDDIDNHRQHIVNSISELAEQLHQTTIGLHHSTMLDEELGIVEKEHLKILKGEALEYQAFELIDNTDPLVSSQVSVSQNLIKQAAAYHEGQWFELQNSEGTTRIKLSLKITQAQQLLFTNFLGIKKAQHSFEEFAYMLSSKIAIPINSRDPFKATGEKIFNSLLERYTQQQQQAASDAAIEEEILRQQEITRQAAKDKALKEAKVFAEQQKAARIKAQQEQRAQAERLATEQHKKDVITQLAQLRVGAVVIFYNDANQGDQCKLAAIIQSSNEHIFVNRDGIKQHALNKQQLSAQLLNGTAKIIDPGSDFENTLEQVVNNLRTRK
ncbi:DUF1631 family protein [Oceanicoccus sagamiensis]|uniref:DUF1631 domain-containing protein n=1 Tax=Oceanicoccus sagamiensis TaxID=716816 RepID=A0A1X9N6C8_9GAMM|nr:DUF1631 family protein [Oceanicoccus sagamiensis]ARN73648.1 hypothetical protein BST96_05655 [Oceanicoccus sagamiensis]